MRRLFQSAIALAILACGAAAAAQTTAPATMPALSTQNLDLLHQLESGTWQQRKAVEREISRWGVSDVPIARAMLAHTASPEAQARLNAALTRLQATEETGASLITMHAQNTPAREVYAELFNQAFAPLKTDPDHLLDGLPPLTIDAKQASFWTVIQQLDKKTGIDLARDSEGKYALRRQAPMSPGPQMISGPFLIVATGTQLFAMPPNGPGDKAFLLQLQINSEPKLTLLQIAPSMKLDKAVDDRGNALELEPTMFGAQTAIPGAQVVVVGLRYPEHNRGKHLASIQGTISGMVALHSVGFDIANPLQSGPQSVDLGGVSLTFAGCKKTGASYQVDLTVGPDPKGTAALSTQFGMSAMHLLDAHGEELATNRTQGTINPQTGSTYSISYAGRSVSGKPAGEPKRLVWELPRDFRWIDIPINFNNVEIPIGNN